MKDIIDKYQDHIQRAANLVYNEDWYTHKYSAKETHNEKWIDENGVIHENKKLTLTSDEAYEELDSYIINEIAKISEINDYQNESISSSEFDPLDQAFAEVKEMDDKQDVRQKEFQSMLDQALEYFRRNKYYG